MPHTSSRYQQDLSFTDGLISFAAPDISAVSATAPVLTRTAVGDYSWVAQASATTYFAVNLLKLLRRSGFSEDLQEYFGGTGIPASAAPQGRPDGYVLPGQPQPATGMSSLQEITPRTAFKLKGIKPKSLTVIGMMATGSPTSVNCSLTMTTATNGATVAAGQTTLLASGTNGLPQTYSSAVLQVTTVAIPNAVFYQITPNTQLWFELVVVEPASNTYKFYGVELACDFNFN